MATGSQGIAKILGALERTGVCAVGDSLFKSALSYNERRKSQLYSPLRYLRPSERNKARLWRIVQRYRTNAKRRDTISHRSTSNTNNKDKNHYNTREGVSRPSTPNTRLTRAEYCRRGLCDRAGTLVGLEFLQELTHARTRNHSQSPIRQNCASCDRYNILQVDRLIDRLIAKQ